MAFSSHQQHVARAEHLDCGFDRHAAIAYLAGTGCRHQYLGADRFRTLASRIVVGNNHHIRLINGDASHDRPFAGVAVTAGAKHDDEPAAGIRPQRRERLGQSVGLVRVVDEDRRAVARARQLETALGAFELRNRGEDACRLGAGGDAQSGGHGGIVHLEPADKRQPDFVFAAGMRQRHGLRETVDCARHEPDRRRLRCAGRGADEDERCGDEKRPASYARRCRRVAHR